MPYVAAIGHRLSLADLLEKFEFEDFDEAECMLEEAGLSLFENDSEDVFVAVTDKLKIFNEGDRYIDLNLTLSEDEEKLLVEYTGCSNKRIKLFWIAAVEEEQEEEGLLEIQEEEFLEIQAFIESKKEVSMDAETSFNTI